MSSAVDAILHYIRRGLGALKWTEMKCLGLEDASPPQGGLLSHRRAGAGGLPGNALFPKPPVRVRRTERFGKLETGNPTGCPEESRSRSLHLGPPAMPLTWDREEHLTTANSHHPTRLGPLKRLQNRVQYQKGVLFLI